VDDSQRLRYSRHLLLEGFGDAEREIRVEVDNQKLHAYGLSILQVSQALARELHEELDIRAEIGEEFFRQEWIYPDGVDNPKKDGAFRVFYHVVRSFTGTPVNRVFEQIRWVDLHDLQALDILEGNKEAVAFLVKHGIQAR